MNPTQKDIDLLKARPDLADKFDEVYGSGASSRFITPSFKAKIPSQKDLNMLMDRPDLADKFDEVYGSALRKKH